MALTTIPGVETLRAEIFSAIITELRPVSARKTADETVNNTSTLQNDDELFVSVAANALYFYQLHAVQNSNGTANFKINFTIPAGASMPRSNYWNATGALSQHGTFTGTSQAGLTGLAGDAALEVWGLLLTSTTAGTLTFQWAQSTADVSNTIVRSGSFLVLTRLS